VVFRAAGLVAALALLSRVLGLVREIVVRQYLGVTTLEATAFDIASRFPEAIFLIVEELAAAHTGPLFLMCACEDAATCHRREVGRLLKKRGYSVSEYPFDES